ncbi:1-(5-phosphoribosyl)-5-[(5-phosphoribosylamino)methylideneamino] imidazole-4-carboxamide isomerase [Luteimonas sp. SX5]|uniref:1-(5-phosphoribosyl)-5-[(5-phosphoribosylamino)methylideneamino] imidazole-4-carboxamide isomerase n=1 Tax=Luteimonas galliterrae TaxID=2940486 RepID=A0ABT0MG86_9GAMM|nr:1-(5-phosphoribosyl)-5-[(5-phosphoribosylamino)methylideneamino] imidazole-4-carboxamide isomerase [Luteimonas galliterrae]MCL1633896.1 1-(5-phosphoribosyl)-5-[(5-phosphoribosylamino)methylideneamino] imidazole-4-carboxamide isomerase [Luteimonas galliterrae]
MNTPFAAVFEVYPAIDVRDGRVVRLAQGDYARETRYGDDPLALAQAYAAAGARWLHLVDLNAARAGGYTLATLLSRIKDTTALSVQTGGGVRGESDIERLLANGADRVVVGSLSASDPNRVAAWLGRYGSERLTIALDARCADDGRWFPATHGWTRQGRRTLGELVRFYTRSGLRHLLCTDIARDGMLSGPNLQLYALLRQWAPQVALQASGGACDLADVRSAREAGCAGIVLGKALLEGRIGLAEALAC